MCNTGPELCSGSNLAVVALEPVVAVARARSMDTRGRERARDVVASVRANFD